MTATRRNPGPAAGRRPPAGQPGPGGPLWWTKLRSLPSTAWSLLITVVSIVGFGVLYCLLRVARPPSDPAALAAFDPTAVSLTGVQLAAIAVGVLGVLLVAGEYATGLTSFTAVPRRLPVLWGKAVVFALTTLAVCLPATLIAFLVGQSILSEKRLDIALATRAWPGGAGQRALPRGRRPARPGPGRCCAAPPGRSRPCWGCCSGPAAGRPAAEHLVGPALPVPAGPGRRGRGQRAARPGDPQSLERVRPVLLYTGVVLALAAWQMVRRDA